MSERVTPLDWSQEILDEIFRHTSVGFVLLDLHGLVLEVNAAFQEMLGFERAELIGRPIEELIPAADRNLTRELTEQLCDEKIDNYEVVRKYARRDGEILTARVTASVVRSKSDEPVCAIEFVSDIGGQLEAEKALRDSEIRYRRVVEDQTEMIVRWLPDGTRIFANEPYRRQFQRENERLIGTSAYSMLKPADRAEVKRKVASLTPDRPAAIDRRQVQMPDGAVRWQEWNDRALFDATGRIVEVQSIGRDITGQKEAEEARRRSESRFHRLFEDLPIAVWEADWGEIVAHVRREGFQSAQDFLERTGGDATAFGQLLLRSKILEVNPRALALAGVEDRDQFVEWNKAAYPPEAVVPLVRAAEPMIFEHQQSTAVELPLRRWSGETIQVLMHWARTETDDANWRFIVSALDQTERKSAEEALTRSESKFRRFFRDLPIAAWMSDWTQVVNGLRDLGIRSSTDLTRYMAEHTEKFWAIGNRTRIVEINPVALKLAGVETAREFEEWIGSGYGRDVVERIVRATAPVIFDGEPVATVELQFGHPGEPKRDFRLQWARMESEEDRFRLIVTLIDLTERRRAELALEESESKFKRLFHELPIAAWMTDWTALAREIKAAGVSDGRTLQAYIAENPAEFERIVGHVMILEVNSAALALGGVESLEGFKRWLPRAFSTNEAIRRLVNVVSPLLFEGRHVMSIELPLARSHGESIEVFMTWARSDAEGQFWRFIVTSIDVTERNRIERDLEQQRHLLEQAESIARIGSWEWNATTREIRGSVELGRILAGSSTLPSVFELRTFLDCVHPDDRHLVGAALRPLAEPVAEGSSGLESSVEFRIVRPDGEVRIVRGQGFMIRNSEGRISGGFGALQDVTDERMAQREAERQREELVRADKMITLGILVSGVAHEINNPNHAIMLNAPLLKKVWGDAAPILDEYARGGDELEIAGLPWSEMRVEVPALMDDIARGSERIRDIVAELKEFARDQDARMTTMVSLNDVAKSARRLAANRIKHATTNFVMDLADNLPPCRGNAPRLEQVVINLVLNACEALTDSSQLIRVTTGRDDERKEIFLRVEDHGRGIEESNLGRILDPFFTTRRSEGGTGLGLAVSNRIIEEHEGTLGYQSVPESGTMATIRLPIAKDEDTKAAQGSGRKG